tara:strand:- start:148 stop:1044 length:897 start_codon:yes stop_codon:yes gene_type:complete
MSISTREYLNSDIITKIDNLFLRAKLVVEGFMIGLHKSPYHGFSVEFSEHRAYGYGDEIKYIDWKLWAKTDKLFIKQFEEETNLKCNIILDKSSSMGYGSSNITKFEYAKTLAAALSYLMIKQQDAVGLTTFDTKIDKKISPKAKPNHLNVLMNTMHNAQVGGSTNISNILHSLAESIKKRGLIILISDLMDEHSDIIKGLRHFRHKGHEVVVFNIMDPREIDLDFNEGVNFIDSENEESIVTDPRQIQVDYKESVKKFITAFKNNCRKNRIDYFHLNTSDSIDKSLMNYLIKRGKLV